MILLVEDNSDDAELIRYAFSKAGVAEPLVLIEDGEEAIAYIEGGGRHADRELSPYPSLLLLDLRLPRRSGFEVLAAVRASAAMRHTPVVVLTSSTQESDIKRAYEAGANSYLVKPVDRDRLLEMVRSLDGYWLKINQVVAP